MFYSNKSSILVSGEGNSSRSKMTSFTRILNLQRIIFLMCIVSSGEITWGMKDDKEEENLGSDSEEKYYLNYKVVFLGDEQVGKTQILNQRTTIPFDNDYSPTVEIGKYKSTINKDNSQTIALSLIDTPGQEAFRVSLSYVQSEQAIVLVYDVTKKESFDNMKKYWLGWAKGHAPKDAVYFLVGNKIDLEDKREVTTEVAQGFAEKNKMRFFEVSAKNGDNLEELFQDIVKGCLIKDKYIKETISDDKLEDNTNNDNNTNNNDESKANEEKINFNQQSTTQTKNKPCICCSCCPCNKENKK